MWYSCKKKTKSNQKLFIEQSVAKIWSQNAEGWLTSEQWLRFRSKDLKVEREEKAVFKMEVDTDCVTRL